MAEGIRVKQEVPIYVQGPTRPPDGEGYTWVGDPHPDKQGQYVGWQRVSITPHSDPEGFLVPPEAGGSETQTFRQGTLREARDGQEGQGEK